MPKDAVTYQSWRWDLIMYQCAHCRDCTLLSYAIRSLQGYPGELEWSSGTDITLDDVLMILDEHYNNVKVLDVLNQELFQLWMAPEPKLLIPPKPRTTSFFPLRNLKGNQPLSKKPAICLVHLEEEEVNDGKDTESDDPGEIAGVTEEFMVQLARAVKDAQSDEKCCYLCSNPKHFIHNCPLMKTSRHKKQLNGKEGTALMKGTQTPPTTSAMRSPQKEAPEALKSTLQTPFLNLDPFQQWYGIKNVTRVKINGEGMKICMTLLDNGAQVNTITLKYVSNHSLQVGPIIDLMGSKVACMGLGNAYMRLWGYIVIWVQVDRVQGYDKDQIALVILDLSNFVAQIPVILGTPTIDCRGRDGCLGNAVGKCQGSASSIGA